MDVEKILTFRKESLIPKVDENDRDGESSKNQLLKFLDEVENRVERFRRNAMLMEEERDILFSSIDSIKTSELIEDLMECEKDEVIHLTDRVAARCSTVEITVRTVRDEMQEESLHQVNSYIDGLVVGLHDDLCSVKDRCLAFIAACASQSSDSCVDKRFEEAILGCTLDDQKRIRRRLQGLLSYIEYSNGKEQA